MRVLMLLLLLITFLYTIHGKKAKNSDEFKYKLKKALSDDTAAPDEIIPDFESFLDIDEYSDYVVEYKKMDKYDVDNGNELKKRFKRFKETKEKIKEWNKTAKKKIIDGITYEEHYGITQFTDMDDNEMQAMYLQNDASDSMVTTRRLLQSQQECTWVPDDYFNYNGKFYIENLASISIMTDYFMKARFQGQKYCSAVKDQKTTNGCWDFATTGQAECNYAWQNRFHPELTSAKEWVVLSEQQILDCTPDTIGTADHRKNSGGWPQATVQYMGNKGYCKLNEYPYSYNITRDVNYQCSCTNNASRLYAEDCYFLDRRLLMNDDKKFAMAVNERAWTFGMRVDSKFMSLKMNPNVDPETTVMTYFDCNRTDSAAGNHAMTVIGYKHTGFWNPEYMFLVKNSYGDKWGMNGYVYMSGDVITTTCGVDAGMTNPLAMNFNFKWGNPI